jgi:hypothetical protein
MNNSISFMEFPEKILSFLNHTSSIDIGFGGFTFYQPDDLLKAQVGYSIDSRKNSILRGIEGEWKKEWIVIGLDDLVGDPIFVDTTTSSFVVMTSEPSTEWNPYPIADSLENFSTILTHLASLSVNRSTPEEWDKNPLQDNEKKEFLTVISIANPDSEIEYWEGFLDLE